MAVSSCAPRPRAAVPARDHGPRPTPTARRVARGRHGRLERRGGRHRGERGRCRVVGRADRLWHRLVRGDGERGRGGLAALGRADRGGDAERIEQMEHRAGRIAGTLLLALAALHRRRRGTAAPRIRRGSERESRRYRPDGNLADHDAVPRLGEAAYRSGPAKRSLCRARSTTPSWASCCCSRPIGCSSSTTAPDGRPGPCRAGSGFW